MNRADLGENVQQETRIQPVNGTMPGGNSGPRHSALGGRRRVLPHVFMSLEWL